MCQLPSNQVNHPLTSNLPIPDLPPQTKKRVYRLKFWELDARYHCAALGTCLTLKELKQIGKKAGIKGMNTWSDYEMHVSFIHSLDSKGYISALANKLLDKKYRLIIQQFSKTKHEEERVDIWNNAVITGDIAGAFWAILTHPSSSENTLLQVYGKVHMLSHLSGASLRIDMKEFYKLEKYNEALEKQAALNNATANKKLQKRELQITKLKEQLSMSLNQINKLEQAQQELDEIKKNPVVETLQNQLDQLKKELEDALDNNHRIETSEQEWKKTAIKEQAEKQRLEQHHSSLREEKSSLENTLAGFLGNQSDADNCASCPNTNPDLCGRCVLYIGGRGSQYSHFKTLVEQQNGQFIHHDGGREDGHQKLASIVSKADVVLCPLDCVSHTAMNAVKKHCQNNDKKLVFIPHASLSAFSKGLGEVVN